MGVARSSSNSVSVGHRALSIVRTRMPSSFARMIVPTSVGDQRAEGPLTGADAADQYDVHRICLFLGARGDTPNSRMICFAVAQVIQFSNQQTRLRHRPKGA